jgi:phage FluMu protein Com
MTHGAGDERPQEEAASGPDWDATSVIGAVGAAEVSPSELDTTRFPTANGSNGSNGYSPPAPAAPSAAFADATMRDMVTCPECGAVQQVQLNRRDSTDFCRACDFPLFWTPAQVLREREDANDGQSLRRLPGTVGRTTLASTPCPHCRELNTVTAEVCVRCGLSMRPVAPPPPPEPVYVPPPPPPVVEEPEPESRWWIWVLAATIVIVVAVVVALVLTDTIG